MIDEQRLKELEDDFGADDLAEIIDAFLEEVGEGVDTLGNMLSDQPSAERKAQLHFLKGCARNLGAMDLGDLCEQYERAELGASAFGPDDFARVVSEVERIRGYFASRDLRRSA